jgi:peroxiredoxin
MNRKKTGALVALAFGFVACTNVWAAQDQKEKADEKIPAIAEIDKPVKDFQLKDLAKELKEGEKEDARIVKFSQFKDKQPIVLFFMSEKCGTTWQYEKRVGELVAKYGAKPAKKDAAKEGAKEGTKDEVKGAAIMSVRCSAGDTEESIVKFAEAKNFNVPVLNDAKGELTAFFKVRNTPTFVVIDKKGVFRYFGSFDDNVKEDKVENKYLTDALVAVLANKDVAVKTTRPFG